jgi:hypothetical protein
MKKHAGMMVDRGMPVAVNLIMTFIEALVGTVTTITVTTGGIDTVTTGTRTAEALMTIRIEVTAEIARIGGSTQAGRD